MALAIVLANDAGDRCRDRRNRQATWRVYGAGITITGPTLRALDRLGLLDAVTGEGYCYDATRICDVRAAVLVSCGRYLAVERRRLRDRAPRIPNGGETCGRCCIDSRWRLARQAAGRAGSASASHADRAGRAWRSAISPMAQRVQLRSGRRRRRHPLALRAMLFPDAPKPAFTGQGCWRAVVPRPAAIDCAHVYRRRSGEGRHDAGVARRRCICSLLQLRARQSAHARGALAASCWPSSCDGFGWTSLGGVPGWHSMSSHDQLPAAARILMLPPSTGIAGARS